jgi:hypothetical protein
METQAHLTANTNQQNHSRPEANFPPSVWGCSFASFTFPETVYYFSSVCITVYSSFNDFKYQDKKKILKKAFRLVGSNIQFCTKIII